jgi:hypothetical protein
MYNDLQHHGIKGQKWGVRRFQKKDGSLTPAGKKRYNDDAEEPKKKKKTVRVAKAFVETYAMDSVTGLVSATLIKNGQEGVGKMISVAGGAMSWASLAKKLYDIATDKDEK